MHSLVLIILQAALPTLCSVEFALEKFKEMILGVDYNSAHRNKEPG